MSERGDERRSGPVGGGRAARPSATLGSRMLLATVIVAVLVAGVFASLLGSVRSLRDATNREARAKAVTTTSLELEKLVLDLETGLRGLVISGRPGFLQPWRRARAQLPARLEAFEQAVADDPEQARRARILTANIRSYVEEYAVPVVGIALENRAVAREPGTIAEGKRRVDLIRRAFDRLLADEDTRAARSARAANHESRRAVTLAVSGLLSSVVLILLFGAYLARAIARPVREVAVGATRLAQGDLAHRLTAHGPGEVGELQRAFNAMAFELERGRDELRAQNEQLRESERAKSELVSIVSHEIRTPLASVLGFTSLLLTREVDAETQRRYLEIIELQGRRLATLLDDFLDVQRLEEGRLELAEEVVDLGELLREQIALYSAQSGKHELALELPAGELSVRGDANRLAQVLGNLLSNAIKYSPEGGAVSVAARRRDGGVAVSVSDDGLGIPDEHRDRIFTKFYRGDAAASGIPGTGLGLAFARAVVEAHDGRIWFHSTPGEGSTFWLELPVARRAAATAPSATDERSPE